MATECQDITVHAATFVHQGGPVFYASLPGEGKTGNGCRANRAAEKKRLITMLLDHVRAMVNARWPDRLFGNRSACPIRVVHDPLGKPHLVVGEIPGPAISFSEGGGKMWGALCGDASDIGIDAAAADEFQGDYPLHRVFHDQELHHALRLTGGNVIMAAALLWSIKEAVVKALGCGFHLVAPLQVQVSPSTGVDQGYVFPVCLSGKALVWYPKGVRGSIWVRSYPLGQLWLSLALLNGQSR